MGCERIGISIVSGFSRRNPFSFPVNKVIRFVCLLDAYFNVRFGLKSSTSLILKGLKELVNRFSGFLDDEAECICN